MLICDYCRSILYNASEYKSIHVETIYFLDDKKYVKFYTETLCSTCQKIRLKYIKSLFNRK